MIVKNIRPMEFQLQVLDPFIICFHHRDIFPKGNGKSGPIHIPHDKNVGEDFDHTADWRMYYGQETPGFPVHPHRGFETITVMMEGYADHFDSKGSKGRYGEGDVQWMTAGKGIQHSEMFPVLSTEKENPMELFQIWLNLPPKDKFAEPGYKMLWNKEIPIVTEKDSNGKAVQTKIIAGNYKNTESLKPLPASWAYKSENKVGIWLIELEAEAEIILPAISPTLNRMIYNYRGGKINIDSNEINEKYCAELNGNCDIKIRNGNSATKLLLLEGEPIGEPISTQGPFVMNTIGELKQAFMDYQETQFGGWQWESNEPINNVEDKRFADYENSSRVEHPKE